MQARKGTHKKQPSRQGMHMKIDLGPLLNSMDRNKESVPKYQFAMEDIHT